MKELLCPYCGKTFPNSPPYRRIGRFIGDIATCPYCNAQTRNPSTWIKSDIASDQGVGIKLQGEPGMTPAQEALLKLNQTAQILDKKGFYKLADQIDKEIS